MKWLLLLILGLSTSGTHVDGTLRGPTAMLHVTDIAKTEVAPDNAEQLPEVAHSKEAGRGYMEGSPLFEKEQDEELMSPLAARVAWQQAMHASGQAADRA
eukprot:gnl/TRDRNA2_/TRDRNA2_85850_c0_seq1.p2 gnl/TRDRNA2_/TRDRNA2_85850_c0~~gnl/TRDRNA2_/TRDRNA2_85850_c0_seq1.p2  ORF type:complete len:100 (-),score=27.93 gnl/TRDRNA2_/TRDRNA2_85850_c0_seq1:205-504(-)